MPKLRVGNKADHKYRLNNIEKIPKNEGYEMKDTASRLLNSVKTAVAEYGLARLSTRNIADTAGVNDALIYRYFDGKEELLRKAYEQESNSIFHSLIVYLDEVYNIPFSFQDKARLHFHKVWRELLCDPDRLTFVTGYFHSGYMTPKLECHARQVEQLRAKLGHLFPDEKSCAWTMYALMTLLYDATKYVVDGVCEDTPDMEERAFRMGYSMLTSQMLETK